MSSPAGMRPPITPYSAPDGDSAPAGAFETVTRPAARLLDLPVAAVHLTAAGRRLLEDAGMVGVASRPEWAGIAWRALDAGEPLVRGDARSLAPFAAEPLVTEHGLVAFIAAPLITADGEPAGALCLGDVRPRSWTAAEVGSARDMAAAALAEIELRCTRARCDRYRRLVEDLDAISWEFDLDAWRFTFVSRRAEAILGYPVRRWIEERGFWEDRVLHPEDRDWAVSFCRDATSRGVDHDFDYRAVCADGRIVWLKDRVRVVPNAEGRPRLLRGVMIDITAEKEATEAARRSEAKFRQIAENVREVFWIFDASFSRAIYVSPAYEAVWGRPVEPLYQDASDAVEAVHPDDVQALQDAMQAVAERPVSGVEYRVVRPDGSVRWVFSRGYPVRDARGEVYRVVGTTEDITERKLAQDRLAAAEAHYRLLVENAPYAIYALDSSGCFVELNPAGEQILERPPGSLIGQHFSTIIAPESLDVATSGFERVMSGEADHLEFDEWVLQASGGKRLVRVTESAMWEGGAIIGTHGVARDITEELEKDRQLRRAERLASIGTLIGGVAHELNNPLQSISSFTSLLLEAGRSEEEREDLETIQREALRASQIVSNLRLLARKAQDGSEERRPLDLNDVVRHVLRTRRYPIETANIEVAQDLAPELPPVLGDRGQLEQVVLNLVVNAEQAMEGAARKRLGLRTRTRGGTVYVEVADSGRGIPRGDVDHIFDPFFTTKSPGEGTGLGLSLVYGIVTEHGGAVHVESEPERGTLLRIAFPRAPAAPEGTERPAPEPAPTRRLRILVVDDEPAIRTALSRYLTRRRGHVVDEAAGGEEALRRLVEHGADYDIILSDLRMPELGGDQLLVRLKALGKGLERRVIFLTGDAASGHAARVLAAANAPVLYKPVELRAVADRIEQLADSLG